MVKRSIRNLGFLDRILDEVEASDSSGSLEEVPIEAIRRGEWQPRAEFNEERLRELANSIREQGLVQPLVVRRHSDGHFELIAGERRWRAAQRSGRSTVPVIVRQVTDEQASILAMVENLHREDLNPMEFARGIHRLEVEYQVKRSEISKRLQISESVISRTLNLLKLPEEIQQLLWDRLLTAAHAAELAGLKRAEQIKLAAQAARGGWSVKALRSRVQRSGADERKKPAALDANSKALVDRIAQHLGAPVAIRYDRRTGKGVFTVRFHSLDECDSILQRMGIQDE